MVERLENMKRNASQSSSPSQNRCAICGDYFCLLRTVPNQCGSCQKILCNKCCIDTQYTLDDDFPNNSTSNHSTNVSSQSRRNSSNSLSMSNSYGGSANNNSNKVTVYLCRLCSEQREFLKKSGVWFMKKYPSYLAAFEKYNSTSNISQIEKNGQSNTLKQYSNASPMCLKRNLSSSSTNSSSFLFWKNNNGHFQNDIDNVSDMSNENEHPTQEYFSNNHGNTNGIMPAVSCEGLSQRSPKSPTSPNTNTNKKGGGSGGEHFSFNQSSNLVNTSNYITNTSLASAASVSAANQANSNTNAALNHLSTDKMKLKRESSSNYSFNKKDNSSSNSNKVKDNVGNTNTNVDNFSEDEDTIMSSYNYYSNIITNLNPTSSLNLINSSNNNNNNNNNTNTSGETVTGEANTADAYFSSHKINKNAKSKNLSINSIADINQGQMNGSFTDGNNNNNNLSSSATNLEMSSFPGHASPRLSFKLSDARRSIKKNKVLEWCSTQLSMDKDDSSSQDKRKKSLKEKHQQSAPVYNNNNNNNNNNSTNYPKQLSSQTVNNLAKKILSQNNSILSMNSIAASSSSAVASASSLTSSITKLNLK